MDGRSKSSPPGFFLLEDSMERQLITHTHANLPPCDRANPALESRKPSMRPGSLQADSRGLQPQNACQLSTVCMFAARQGSVVSWRSRRIGKSESPQLPSTVIIFQDMGIVPLLLPLQGGSPSQPKKRRLGVRRCRRYCCCRYQTRRPVQTHR
ncbi:uncharacterized protein LY79DRAFT_564986, partial [Colletotrichum navitas]